MTRAWFFPELTPAISHSFWLATVLAAAGTLFVIPTAGEVPIIQVLQQFGLGGAGAAALLITLPAVSLPSTRNVGAGVADARTDRARLRNVRLWPVRFSGGGSYGTIVGSLMSAFGTKQTS